MAFTNLPASAAEALRRGSRRYFTGEPCASGHIGPRLARSRRCIMCLRGYYNRTPRGAHRKEIENALQT